jgi:hypothetical protein
MWEEYTSLKRESPLGGKSFLSRAIKSLYPKWKLCIRERKADNMTTPKEMCASGVLVFELAM